MRRGAPSIRFIDRVVVIGRIAGIDLSGSVTDEQRSERFINESGVGASQGEVASALQELGIHGGAQTYAVHATSMPLREGEVDTGSRVPLAQAHYEVARDVRQETDVVPLQSIPLK